MDEIWKVHPIYWNYAISSFGRVKRLDKSKKMYKLQKDKLGYWYTALNGRFRRVHRLVLEAFVGLRPEGMECRHLDGNPSNSSISNLAWGTPKQNAEDKVRHGRRRNGFQKLTVAKVVVILEKHKRGVKQVKLALEFDVTPQTIRHIVSGVTWKNVPR